MLLGTFASALSVHINEQEAGRLDGCSIEEFEKDLRNNLFRIWNRMSSVLLPASSPATNPPVTR